MALLPAKSLLKNFRHHTQCAMRVGCDEAVGSAMAGLGADVAPKSAVAPTRDVAMAASDAILSERALSESATAAGHLSAEWPKAIRADGTWADAEPLLLPLVFAASLAKRPQALQRRLTLPVPTSS